MRGQLIAGVIFILAGLVMGRSLSGLTIEYRPPFAMYSPGEFNLWMVYFTLWLPGAWLIGLGVSSALQEKLSKWSVLNYEFRKELQISVLATLVLSAIYRIGRAIFLLDQPVTDEEFTNQFGGRILASGQWFADLNIPYNQMPTLFLLEREQGWTSFDFPGIQLAWAFSELTQTGPWIFALLSALSVVGMYWVGRELFESRRWALVGAAIYGFSPMVTMLSMTTHAHILSRSFLVFFLWAFFRAFRNKDQKIWILAGIFWGLGMLSRPAETLTLTAPLLAYFVYHSLRHSPRSVLAFGLGVLPPTAMVVLHNLNVSGVWWKTPRMAENSFPGGVMAANTWAILESTDVLFRRLADNVINNVRYTVLYWFGGIGAVAAGLGIRRGIFPVLLTLGLAFQSGVGLLHDNDGVRVVGPIHYSEWVVFLSLLAVFGLRRIWPSESHKLVAPAFIAGLISSILVSGVMATSLQKSNSWHSDFFEFVESNVPPNSVVMAPRNGYFWNALKNYNRSWVFETRSPKPDLSDDVLILRYTTGAENWAVTRFPDRNIYLVKPAVEPPYMKIEAVQVK